MRSSGQIPSQKAEGAEGEKGEPKRKVVLSIAFAGISPCPRLLVSQVQKANLQERETEGARLDWGSAEGVQGGY